MSSFYYQARSGSGELRQGEMQAGSENEVIERLNAQGLVPVRLEKRDGFFDFSALFKISTGGPRVKMKELSLFFRQLGVMVNAGVPLLESLVAVEDQLTNEKFKKIVRKVESDIGGGTTFSQAAAKQPRVFSSLTVAMLEAGERSGTMEAVMERITAYYEKEMQFRQKIQTALRYPLMVMVALAIAFVVVITVVIPQFARIYSAQKAELPLPTRILINLNYLAVNYWWLLALSLLFIFLAGRFYLRTPGGRLRLDQLILKTPVLKLLVVKVSLSRFFRMLSSMLCSGIPIVSGLDITGSTADNLVIAQTISRLRDRVVAGASLAGTMGEEKLFPATAVQMVAVGEKSGALEKMLVKSADYFDEESDYMISNLMSLMEPFIILFLGAMVLVLALGIFLPMWNMMSIYSH